MSTALSTHHRISDPIAAAAAVVVIVAGATVLGVAAFQDDPTSATAPAAPTHGKVAAPNPPSRVGMGDFTQPQQGGHLTPLKGGHTTIGMP
jgi:hypothetical protein